MLEIVSEKAPKAVGPYSQGIKEGSLLFISGQIPIDPKSGKPIQGDIRKQTELVIDHIESILQSGGSDLNHVVRVDIFLVNLQRDFSIVNEVYARRFSGIVKPARQTVEVSRLPLNVQVEISCIATVREL